MIIAAGKMRRALTLSLGLVLLFAGIVKAQRSVSKMSGTASSIQKTTGINFDAFRQTQRKPLTEEQALEHQIDPEKYILGPGDVVGISMIKGIDEVFEARITPEGNLVIPMMSTLHVGGMSLAVAADTVAAIWGRQFPEAVIKLTLVEIRLFRVTVAGAVAFPGTYFLTPVDRASMLIELAGGLLDETYWREYYKSELSKPGMTFDNLKKNFNIQFASERNIKLYHNDGMEVDVDMLQFKRSGENDSNPVLKEGDRLVVSYKNEFSPSIAISGGVLVPGVYEWKSGDTVQNLIDLAGGLLPDADRKMVQITRFGEDNIAESLKLNLTNNSDTGFKLQPADMILVGRKAETQRRTMVEVKGEVQYPGYYPIVEGQSTLSEVIKMAGGFNDFTFLDGIQVYRKRKAENLLAEIERLDETPPTSDAIADYQFYQLNYRWQKYDRVGGNLGKVFIEDNSAEEPLLMDGDVVYVPNRMMSVLVIGQVQKPGLYQYKEGYNYKDYVVLAGGFTSNAQQRRRRLLSYETSTWKEQEDVTKILPGDVIFIPEVKFTTTWEEIRDYFAVVSQVATVIAVIISLTK